jgi:5-methyltetrahydrofolate--homocysteine methyltransferase
MKTVLSSAKKSVVISPDDPFVVIGERINPTNRKKLAEELRNLNYTRAKADAIAQVEAGAHMIDVNCGVPGADEPAILKGAVEVLQETVDVPLSLDSSRLDALEAALPAYRGKALINSVTGEDKTLDRLLPLIKKYNAAVIGITHDEAGISKDPKVRLAVAKKIVKRAGEYGIPPEDVIIDTICMPVGADSTLGRAALETVRLVREELGVNISLGAGNVGFGMPERPALTASLMQLGMPLGLTASIANPLEPEIARAVRAADLMLGKDKFGMKWMAYCRKQAAAAQAAAVPAAPTASATPPAP